MSKAIDFISSCGGSGFDWTIKTHDFNIEKDNGYFIDTSSNSITATLPSNVSIGDGFYLVDSTGSLSDAEKLVIDNNGHNIMGLNDVMEVTEKYMSLYMVYADATKGWVIADGKGCDEDTSGGEITIDTTIYLAPSASSQTPLNVTGSDITGDGSITAPFFSIKRAMEYLENYRIKVGVYVTIRGLSGKYYYNPDHIVEIRHKDAKYIKVEFDMLETGKFHETTIDFTAGVSVTNNSDHDLITFKVGGTGSDFYQLSAGDYIKIIPDNSKIGNEDSAIWQGYYKITSVSGSNVTIRFKRAQSGGSYNSSHPYRVPDGTGMSSVSVKVIKLSTHVYITYTSASTDFFITSRYGFGGLQINASDELYDSSPNRGCNFSYIYDGELHDTILHLNGFDDCCHYTNLDLTFNTDDDRLYSCATSCDRFFGCLQCSATLHGISANCCVYPFEFVSSDLWIVGYKKVCFTNNYSTGFNLNKTKLAMVVFNNESNIINSSYNSIGLSLTNNASIMCNSVNCKYNNYGVSVTDKSIAQFFFGFNVNTIKTEIKNNSTYGIFCTNNSVADISYTDISNNSDTGVRISDNSSVITSAVTNASAVNSYCNSNGAYGIYCNENSIIRLYRTTIDNNTLDGVYCTATSSASLTESECSNNTGKGVFVHTNSALYCSNIKCEGNGDWGMRILFNSKAYIVNGSSTYRINNNTTYNLVADYNSSIDIRTHDAITNVSPAKNNGTPSYTNASQGNYILESII